MEGTTSAIYVGAAFERLAMDILGLFPRTDRGNKNILVVGDYISKWLEKNLLRDQEATTIAKAFVERNVPIFGVPLPLHLDQGSNFESTVLKEVCQILGIHRICTIPQMEWLGEATVLFSI